MRTEQYNKFYFGFVLTIIQLELQDKTDEWFDVKDLHELFKTSFMEYLIQTREVKDYKKSKKFTTVDFTTEQFSIFVEFVIDKAINVFQISPEKFKTKQDEDIYLRQWETLA
jgi:hypothetical protein